jgi:predicted permease
VNGLLVTLVGALALGVLLRRLNRVPAEAAPILNRIILDITLPALVIVALCDAELDRAIIGALLCTAVAQAVGLFGAIGVARAFGLPRATQGAAGLTGAFANTGFLGVPVAIALFQRGVGPSTAILIDSFNTTVLLWTSGLMFARHMAEKSATARPISPWRALATPLTAAVLVGLVLKVAHVPLPLILRSALDRIGAATTALVFLSLGLSLDLGALRGRVTAIGAVSAVKLVVAPLAAYAVVRACGIGGPIAQVSVMQSAMPTSMLSAVLAAESGCDGAFAAGVAVTTTIVATVTLPLVLNALGLGAV